MLLVQWCRAAKCHRTKNAERTEPEMLCCASKCVCATRENVEEGGGRYAYVVIVRKRHEGPRGGRDPVDPSAVQGRVPRYGGGAAGGAIPTESAKWQKGMARKRHRKQHGPGTTGWEGGRHVYSGMGR